MTIIIVFLLAIGVGLIVVSMQIIEMERKIMATQKELAEILNGQVVPQMKKVNLEIVDVQATVTSSLEKIAALEKVIADEGEASQALTDAVAAVRAEVQLADDKIPDPVVVPAPVTPQG